MFKTISDAVNKNYSDLIKKNSPMFMVSFNKEKVWDLYLDGFKNEEIRRSYDCNNCKSFFRRYSGIVSLDENLNYITLFDNLSGVILLDDEMTNDGMAQSIKNIVDYIKSCPLSTITQFQYNAKETMGGVKRNTSMTSGITWHHFNIDIPNKFICDGSVSADTKKGEFSSKVTTLQRCLTEIPTASTELLIELIDQGSIYRGTEFRNILTEFLKIQKNYEKVTANKERYAFLTALTTPTNVTNIRNTAIGTLLVNIAENMDLDVAVKKYEAVTAPTNYKRPTALVTTKMVEDAKKVLQELDLVENLNRRFAVIEDVNVNDVLHTYTNTKNLGTSGVFDTLLGDETINPKSLKKVEEVSIENFIEKVLPTATKVQVLMENRHKPNLVSLITSNQKTQNRLFKWDNDFSWSYVGGITDSIKENVKSKGGLVDGALRVSLSWSNSDDLDLHMYEPKGTTIAYNSSFVKNRRGGFSPCGGQLDLDMNAGGMLNDVDPVENIIYPLGDKFKEGDYRVRVNNFSKRSSSNVGYTVQVEYDGQIFEFTSNTNKSNENVVTINYSKKDGFTIKTGNGTENNKVRSENVWGIDTYKLHDVSNIMLSPNYWGESKVGNKHYFFILENCVSDDKPRPFFNEFLRSDLDKHRKVFEVLGSKVAIEENPRQLSGLGFSETIKNSLIVKVTSKFERYIKINF